MEKFSMSRCGRLIVFECRTQWKKYLRMFLWMCGALVAKTVVVMGVDWARALSRGEEMNIAQREGAAWLLQMLYLLPAFLIFFGFVWVYGARLFEDVHRKATAIDLFGLPANNGEKFLARLLSGMVFILLATSAAIVLGFGFDYLVLDRLADRTVVSDYLLMVAHEPDFLIPCVVLLTIPWFILPGLLLRRGGWLAGLVLAGFILLVANWLVAKEMWFPYWYYGVIALICLWLSYRVFCRSQVSSTGLFNL